MRFKEFYKYLPKNAFIDKKIRKAIGGHYSIDTNVITYIIGFDKPHDIRIKPFEIRNWFNQATITIYPHIFGELFTLLRGSKYRQKAKNLLDRKNVRIVYTDTLSKRRWVKTLKELDPELTENLLTHIKRDNIDPEDITLMVLSKYENARIFSYDSTINRLSFYYDLNFHETRINKKPSLNFTSPWEELIKNVY